MITGLTTDMNGGAANTEVIDSAGDGTRRGRHYVAVM